MSIELPLEPSVFGTTTLGELTKAIERFERLDSKQLVSFDFGDAVPTRLASYRGFYDHLAIGFDFDYPKTPTLSVFLGQLLRADGTMFAGYKGGNYVMGPYSPIWVANPGSASSTAIVAVYHDDYQTIIRTQWVRV